MRPDLVRLAILAILAAIAIAILAWAHLRYWARRLTLDLEYAEHDTLKTDDGAIIELRRVPLPRGTARAALPPVLLVHGLGANHRNQDLCEDYSLARYLAALGRDVWLVTLRSGRRRLSRAERRRVRFAAMARIDVPLAIATVLARTGSLALDYVGFSMGGMLLYAALGTRSVAPASLRRAVIVGSPGRVAAPYRFLRPLVKRIPRWLVPSQPLRTPALAVAFASEWLRTPIHRVVSNPLNVSPGITRAALANLVESVPSELNADFWEWAGGDGEIRVDGARVLDGLADVEVPALFIAGAADKLAPPPTVEHAFDAWGKARPSVPKRYFVAGRDYGHAADYGHGDMAIGTHVGAELFEPIAKFLGPEDQPEDARAETGAEAVEDVQERRAIS